METLWFILVAFMLTMYVLLDGFDLGVGIIYPFAARNETERRTMLRAIGPVWDGNEVWLLAAGGTLFFTFPRLYASSFSGFYLPLTIVLWLLILRGLAIELRAHTDNMVWSAFWDAMFFIGSALLAVFFGAAIANVVRGVPLDHNGYFFEPLWTNFDPKNPIPGILDWYTILIGVLALSTLVMHGANFTAVKSEGALNSRARRFSQVAWVATVVLTVGGTLATIWLRRSLFTRFNDQPWGYIFPLIAIAGLLGAGYFTYVERDGYSLIASGAYITGMLTSTAFGLYPKVLPAIEPVNSLTINNAASHRYALVVGLVWWIIGMVLAAIYLLIIYNLFKGKVRLADEGS